MGVTTSPKISRVKPQADKLLLVDFANGEKRLYDCKPLLLHEEFRLLSDDAFFKCAKADPHGYGVVWSDEVDLAESEIWLNGERVKD